MAGAAVGGVHHDDGDPLRGNRAVGVAEAADAGRGEDLEAAAINKH